MQCQRRIESLTPEQQELLAVYRDRWIAIGLSTEPADRPRAEAGIRAAYKAGHLAAPERIVWCQSPLSQGLTRAIVFEMTNNASGRAIRASIKARAWDSLRASGANIEASVWDSVWASGASGASVGARAWAGVRGSAASAETSVGDTVGDRVWDSVGVIGAEIGARVWGSIGARVWDSIRAIGASRGSAWDSFYGQHDAGGLAFYRYFHDVCGLADMTAPLAGMWEVAESAGWWLPHANLCWVSERPIRLSRDSAGRLHDEGDMAIAYPDGWGVYALHGVRVPAALVMTPASELDPAEWVLKQANAEIRREAVRKIGIERVCARLGARVIDRRGEYELLSLDLGDRRHRPYLKMRNPSVGTYHVEGVHPECTTVEQAVNWRALGDRHKPWHPEVLT